MATRKELEALRVSAPARSALRVQCEAAASRRVWATGPVHDLSPLAAERGGFSFGEELDGEPDDLSDINCFVFDARGRLVVSRAHSELRPSSQYTEEFVVYPSDDVGVAYSFDKWAGKDKPPIGVARIELSQDRPVTITTLGRSDMKVERIRWGEHGPVEIDVARDDAPASRYEVTYADGALDTLYDTSGDAPVAIYMASPPELAASLSELRESLSRAIQTTFTKSPASERVYCAVLPHCPDSKESAVPDEILLGLAATRPPASEGAEPSYAPYYLEDAGALVIAVDSDALAELRTKIALALRSEEDYEAVRSALVAVTAELNQRDWSDVLDVTDDFLFLPVNIDGSDLGQHLAELGRG